MQLINLFLFLIFETLLGGVVSLPDPQRVTITHAMWDGVVAYIAVDRQAVQDKLDAFHDIEINGQRDPKLYLPTTPAFDDILTEDQHVIYVEFGFIDSLDLGGEPSISSHGSESAIIIPFLADSPDGASKCALTLGSVYQRDRGAVSKLNIAFPYFGIDDISVTDTGVAWRNGSSEPRATFVKSNPCKAASKVHRHEFEALIDEELDFSFSEPDLEYCNRHSLVDHQVCDTLKNFPCGLESAGPNVCQFYQPPWEKSCETSLDNVSITGGFLDLLILKDSGDPINVVSSEGLYGEYRVGLQYPVWSND